MRGNVVGDESYFRGDRYGTGWQWNDALQSTLNFLSDNLPHPPHGFLQNLITKRSHEFVSDAVTQ